MKLKIVNEQQPDIFPMHELKRGEIGVVLDGTFRGSIVVKTANMTHVVIGDETATDYSDVCDLKVRLLREDDKLELVE